MIDKLTDSISLKIKASEMRHWEAERIYRFFQGLAQMIRAVRN